jgi:hypothetical protein
MPNGTMPSNSAVYRSSESHTGGSIVLKLNKRKSHDAKSRLVSATRLKWEYPAFFICVKYSETRFHSHHSEVQHSRSLYQRGLFLAKTMLSENDLFRDQHSLIGFLQLT